MPVATLRQPRSTLSRDGLLTLEEAAVYLQIAPGTLKHWIALKKIEHVKVGKYTRFTQGALDRYISAQTVSAAEERVITAIATGPDGEKIIVLGVTRENIRRLTAGQPIKVDAVHHPGFPVDLNILIYFGETERTLTEQLKPLISDQTKVVAVAKDEHEPS